MRVTVILAALVLAATAASAQSRPISAQAVRQLLESNPATLILDVRTRWEFMGARIPGSVLLPYDAIDAASASSVVGPKDRPVVVYCGSGRRSATAASALAALGYQNVFDLGGIGAWPYGTVRGD